MDIQTLIRPTVKALAPYTSARDDFDQIGAKMTFLDANENPFDTTVNRYPNVQPFQLINKLAALKQVSPNQILLGNGSDEVLDLIVRAFCEPGIDNVITLPPTYGMYKVLAAINNIENRAVLLNRNFQPNISAILQAADSHSKVLFLCSPNNPTGNVFSVKNVLELLQKFKGLVVIDEAYIDFSSQESWLNAIDDYPNLIITQTMSKAYGMAGIRIGVCYASKEIIEVLNKIKAPYNVNVLSIYKALEKLTNIATLKKEVAKIKEGSTFLIEEMQSIPFIKKIYPTEANFILVKVDNAAKRYQQLLEHKIVVRDRSSQPLCNNCLRITVGTQTQNKQLVKLLKKLEL
ncbi:histidinol-phosphate transaminase [Lutibacter sp.]